MKQRIITGFFIALVYAGTVLGAILWNPLIFDVFAVFLMFAAGWEMCGCLDAKFLKTVRPALIIAIAVCYAVYKLVSVYAGLMQALVSCVLTALIFAVVILNFTMFSKKYTVSGGAATAFVLLYPVLFIFIMLGLAYLPENYYSGAIIMLFISSSLADTMAYFVGSALKGPKFCPQISPKKTVSGAVGGLIGGIISGLIVFTLGRFSVLNVVVLNQTVWLDLLHWCFIGLGSAAFCEMGDLTSSYVKRVCGIKDFGSILAGHGGFMDRIDGMIVSSVYIFAYMFVLGFVF